MGCAAGTVAMATFGLYRYRSIQTQGAGEDLAWAPPPGFTPDDPQAVYGFQLTINAFSKQKEAAWQFVKFMTGPAAQAIAAQGGEVVARASAYNDPYFASPQGRDQRAWAELIKSRGRQVNYSDHPVDLPSDRRRRVPAHGPAQHDSRGSVPRGGDQVQRSARKDAMTDGIGRVTT